MTALARAGGTVAPAAASLAAAAAYAVLRPGWEQGGLAVLAAAAAVAAVAWALADLEGFLLVPLLAAMTFPATVLQAGGALVAAADLLLLVALGAWLARAALGTAPPLRSHPLAVPGLLFVAATASSLAWTSDAPATAKATVQMLELVVVVPALFASIPSALSHVRRGLVAYVGVSTALALVTGLLFGARALGGDLSAQYLAGLHKNAIGTFLGVGLVLAFVLSLDRTRAARDRGLLRLAVALQLAGLIASISRGAMVGAFVALVVAVLLLRRARLWTVLGGLAVAFAFLVTVQAQLSQQTRALGGYSTTLVRELSYANALEKIRAEPLLGTGAGTYWDDIAELRIGLADPNNLFLLTAAELGVVGVAALLFLLYRFGRTLVGARRLPEEARAVAIASGAGALSVLVHGQFDAFWTRGTATLCFALAGTAIAAGRLGRPHPAQGASARAAAPAQAVERPLRVLHLVSSDAFAGIERHVLRLARGLRERGLECTIACPPGARRLRAEARAAGVPVVPGGHAAGSWMADLAARTSVDPPDIVHVHDGRAAVAGWRIAVSGRTRLVRTQHFVRPASAERSGWRRVASLALHRVLNTDVDALVAVSESVAASVRERHEAGSARVSVIHPGVDAPSPEAVEAALAARRRKRNPVVAYLGRLEREKGPQALLLAMPLVLERLPRCKLLVAGTGSFEPELRVLARRLRLGRSVTWLGAVDGPAEVFGRAHLLVSPCAVEGFGLAAVEAMAWALPVVGIRSGGVAETVEDGVSGLLVDDEDPAALADAIVRLAGDRDLAVSLGAAARERACERFTAETAVERTAALYESLARRR